MPKLFFCNAHLSLFSVFSSLSWKYNTLISFLRRKEIRVLYFHDNDENTENRLRWALQKKSLGIVKEIGLSVYELSEIKNEWIDYIDTIQIPMSLYDRRAENHPLLKVLVEKEVLFLKD